MLRDQILAKVRLRLAGGRATAEIRLDPPDLGRMTIELEHRDEKIVAAVRVEHDAVAQVVHRYVEDLREVFAAAGVMIDRFEVVREKQERQGGPWVRAGRHARSRAEEREEETSSGTQAPRATALLALVDVVV